MILDKLKKIFHPVVDKKHIKILVIEDSPVDQKVISIAINAGGYSGVYATDGKTGLEQAQALLPDMIILDYNLPDIQGPDLCKILKLDEKTRAIPVLFLTAQDSPGSVIDCYEQGGENYLYKPVKSKFLLKNIEEIINSRKT